MNNPLIEKLFEPGQPDLFEFFGLAPPSKAGNGFDPNRMSGAFFGGPRLAWSRSDDSDETTQQLELSLWPDRPDRIVDFLTSHQREYLNYAVRDLGRPRPDLERAVRLLSRKGIHFVGDLLRQEPGYLKYVVGLTQADIERLNAVLGEGGLRLAMLVPYWTAPFKRYA